MIVAVAVLCESLHAVVLQIARAEAENCQINAGAALLRYELGKLVLVGDAHVEVAVGGKNNTVAAVRYVVARRDVVGHIDARLAVGAA